jgi:hypothetical protein
MTDFATILAELADPTATHDDGTTHDHNVFQLATLADCASPDSVDSPGARFLARIARDVADRLIDTDEDLGSRYVLDQLTDGDGAHEIADSAVPIYTHERWQVFVDLAAYNEDPAGELGDDGSDLTQTAGVALYIIADRLVGALAQELSDVLSDEEDDEEQDTRPDGTTVYYTRNPSDGYYTAVTGHGVQIGPGRFETIEDARDYLASLDELNADA